MPIESKNLSRDDIFLLMESYRNMVQMHTTLIEQQKQVITSQQDLVKKLDSVINKQNNLYSSMESVSKCLESCAEIFSETNDKIISNFNDTKKSINDNVQKVEIRVENVQTSSLKEFSSIKNRLYISYGAMSVIIISLITLTITAYEKFSMFQEGMAIIKKIAEYFNIG